MAQLRIGDDGSIISSDGEIQQGNDPIIGEDGSIRLGQQPVSTGRSSYADRRTPPTSPLESGGQNSSSMQNETERVESASSGRAAATNTRSVDTIEYELQVKKAERKKCIRPMPVAVCVIALLIAFLMSSFVPAIVSVCSGVFIAMDAIRLSQVSDDVSRLESELSKARGGVS